MAELTMEAPARKASDMRGLFFVGWSAVMILFGGLFAWSVFAPFEGAVLASGLISVESNQQAVQHLEGGIVGAIYVKEGDRVDVGQTLVTLDGTAIQARLSSVEARLFEQIAREARLLAERDDSVALAVRPSLANLAELPAVQVLLTQQQELLAARAKSRSTQVSLLDQSVLQLRQRISGLENEIATNDTRTELIGEEITGLETLLEKKLVPKSRVLALQRRQAELLGDRERLASEGATARIQIGELQIELNRLTEGFREEVLTELREVQTEVSELAEQRIASLDQLKRLKINAPRAGRAIGVQTHTVGGVIAPREPMMYIVPENDPLVALVRIAPQDIDKVAAGNQAVLRFPAFSANVTPEVYGSVTKVSADALRDDASGLFYYEGVIEIPEGRLANAEFQLLPGMPVDASLRTESRTVVSYLLKPLGDAMSKTFRE